MYGPFASKSKKSKVQVVPLAHMLVLEALPLMRVASCEHRSGS